MPIKKKIAAAYEDIEREVVRNDKIVKEVIPADLQKRIVSQIDDEYTLSFAYNEAKRAVHLARLKLYNNQRKDSSAVGDPLLFTVFNTVHAALYADHLMARWEGRGGEGDDEVEENLNALSEFDYDVMQKSESDYYWNC